MPGLLWLTYFYRKDRFEPEPKSLVLKLFAGGMLMVIPAGFLERFWRAPLTEARMSGDIVSLFFLSLFMIGLIEEGVKMLLLGLAIYPNPELDEPVDGIVYGVTVGLGFAAVENLFYTWALGYTVGIVRAIVGCLAHASFTGWGGSYLCRAKKSQRPWLFLTLGLAVAILWHGLYDFLLFTGNSYLSFAAFLMVGLLIFRLLDKMKAMVNLSPFRK
ncbi:MAG TPA: PrsW family glutamic-type intramembrane protease [Bacillota bacterium]|nr:PrsW family glutamic-type intramembrane protease [Bacillota bacterium]